ncbi:hypothetical protein [Prauserella flavalba]|uniref:Uncharacterized protein n=1 Tax=Prauserella flavalba TaxID=1477506 RepID=A0A318LLW1_9PSEU|nr:hypothetical protein [Prauserella flavalba]PXY17359.1 hypothetical protein BA062_37755 [Prauserella flavalba]
MSKTELSVIVRTVGEVPELVAAFPERFDAEVVVSELGPGHFVAPVRVVPPGETFVAHVWLCRATVHVGQRYELSQPERLAGASRLVLNTEDMPGERVHVDEHAADLEAAVHGREWRYVNAYAASAERAQQLASEKARELLDG